MHKVRLPALGYDPNVEIGTVEKKRNATHAHNTVLNTGGMNAQACCKCFGHTTKGSCAGHTIDMTLRLHAAEDMLEQADAKIRALEEGFKALGKVNLRCEGDARGFLNALAEVVALRHVEKLRPAPKKVKS